MVQNIPSSKPSILRKWISLIAIVLGCYMLCSFIGCITIAACSAIECLDHVAIVQPLCIMIGMVLVCLLPTCLYLKAIESIALWKAIRITRPTKVDLYIAFGLICCVLISMLVFFYSKLPLWPDSFHSFKQWAWETSNDISNSYAANFTKGGVYLFVQLINQVIVAPFFEEFFFRGLLLYMLFQQVERRWALLISALLFSLYHLNLYYLVGYWGLGLVFGYLYYVKQNIALAIFAHGCYNLLANIVNYCAYKGYADIFHWIAHLTIVEAILIEGIGMLLIYKLCKALANK